MKALQRIGKLLLGLVAGAFVGYIGSQLILWLADGGMPSDRQATDGADYGLLFLSVALSVLWMMVAVFIHVVLHEAGHLVMGLLTGYRFLSFRIFKYTLVRTDHGLRCKSFFIAGTGGQCIMELPDDQDTETAPWFWYNAGGVLMNLLLVVLSVVTLRFVELGIAGFSFFMMLAFVGIFMALLNGIPMLIGGVNNDGYNLWSLWRHPADKRFFVRMLQVVGAQSRGLRMSEMPTEWFEDLPTGTKSSIFEISNRILYLSLLEDQMNFEAARQVAEEVMSLGKSLPQLLRMEVGGERVMLELLTTRRQTVVSELWSRSLARYTEANSRYSPMKGAVLCAYELFCNHDADKARTYQDLLQTHQHDYTMPGEARTALALVQACFQIHNS